MRIGFIGLGMMGSHMVAHLQNAGHELVVHDVRRAAGEAALGRGARWAETPADAARQSQMVMTSLPGPKEVELVVLGENGIIHGAPPERPAPPLLVLAARSEEHTSALQSRG